MDSKTDDQKSTNTKEYEGKKTGNNEKKIVISYIKGTTHRIKTTSKNDIYR